MESISVNVEKLIKTLYSHATEFQDELRGLHEAIGDDLNAQVDESIGHRINDGRGLIRGFQQRFIGTRGGYAAVRPKAAETGATKYTGKNSPGAITSYLEQGHKRRRPRDRGGKAIGTASRVSGRWFYKAIKPEAVARATAMIEDFAIAQAEKLEETLK